MRYKLRLLYSACPMLFIACFLISCTSTYWEMQEDFLLPESLEIERLISKEIGISTLNTYKITGELEAVELKGFPKYAMKGRGWGMVQWHSPTNQEIINILALKEQDDIDNEVKSVLEAIRNNEYLIAYAQDTDAISFSKDGYETYEWFELYFLNIGQKELTHISYGKF